MSLSSLPPRKSISLPSRYYRLLESEEYGVVAASNGTMSASNFAETGTLTNKLKHVKTHVTAQRT
jgi:hypothetical protein